MRARFAAAILIAGLVAQPAHARTGDNIIQFLRGREDLTKKDRARWVRAARRAFGGGALDPSSPTRPEIAVAKAIFSSAIFMGASPKEGAAAAWEGYRGALGPVPPPIAIHYNILALQGRKPRGTMLDLAFKFPDYYNDEIAPALVAYWQTGIRDGTLPDAALSDAKEALEVTRKKMRPLLLDKMRLLARLDRELVVAKGVRRAEIETDMRQLEDELSLSFDEVTRRPEVLDRRKRPYDRLRILLEDLGMASTAEDRFLDPGAPAPPRKPVPGPKVDPTRVPTATSAPDVEPVAVPAPALPPPPQPRPGDPHPYTGPLGPRAFEDLRTRYVTRLEGTITPWLGTPYRWGGAMPGIGTDCSGFTRGVYEDGFDIQLPRTSRDQFRVGRSIQRRGLQVGDLLFFDMKSAGQVDHVGIYTGKGEFVHASKTKGVTRAKLRRRIYDRAYRGARRLLAYPRQ